MARRGCKAPVLGGGAELREPEAPTVTRTTGCSLELLVAASSLQTFPQTQPELCHRLCPQPKARQEGCSGPPTSPLRQAELRKVLETP